MVDIVRILRRSIAAGHRRHALRRPRARPPVRPVQRTDASRPAAGRRRLEPHHPLRHRADGGEELHGRHRGRAHGGRLRGAARRGDRDGGSDGTRRGGRWRRRCWPAASSACSSPRAGPSPRKSAAARPKAVRPPAWPPPRWSTLADGTLAQSVAAASMAFQSMLGLICDPIANRVEVPCLGKNVMAASNALSCANMALAGYDPVIPLDEVIETAQRVAGQMPRELRCTALGGLSITPTSQAIEQRLAAKKAAACGSGCACHCDEQSHSQPLLTPLSAKLIQCAVDAAGPWPLIARRLQTKPKTNCTMKLEYSDVKKTAAQTQVPHPGIHRRQVRQRRLRQDLRLRSIPPPASRWPRSPPAKPRTWTAP